MQRQDDAKRRLILETAARLFASRRYDEVRLEDVAAEASLGKGTLYVYFASKEALYLTLVRDGLAEMVAHARRELDGGPESVWARIAAIVRGLIRFGTRYPDLYRVMRSGTLTPEDPELQRTRTELIGMIEQTLRAGQATGEVDDPHPELTSQYVPALVRGALLYPPEGLTPGMLEQHIVRVLRRGVGGPEAGR